MKQVSKNDLPGDVEQEEHNNHIKKQCVEVRVNHILRSFTVTFTLLLSDST
jgi:hypothetical protein